MQLVEDWKIAWRWFSVQFSAVGATATALWLAMSESQRAAVLDGLHQVVGISVNPGVLALLTFIAVLLGRVVDQK